MARSSAPTRRRRDEIILVVFLALFELLRGRGLSELFTYSIFISISCLRSLFWKQKVFSLVPFAGFPRDFILLLSSRLLNVRQLDSVSLI